MKTKKYLSLVLILLAIGLFSCSSIDYKDEIMVIEGIDGQNSLAVPTQIGPGENCEAGGIKIDFGVDSDGNGILNPYEITSTAYVCHGVDGQDGEDGLSTVIDLEPINAGIECPNGGVMVHYGLDLNRNSVLDEDERMSSRQVCNGIAGTNSLIRTEEVSASENGCENGGFVIYAGYDTNSNGSLDEDEVQSTETICNGVDGLSLAIRLGVDEEVDCENGGAKVYFGLDANRNGELDQGEETTFIEVCNGIDGEDGYNSLQRTKKINPSPKHPNGGYRILIGLDLDRDNYLDKEEITSRIAIFHGADGLNSLTDTKFVPVSKDYPYGGYFLYTGLDKNQNGHLDAHERRTKSFISNGIDGADGRDGYSTLVEVVPGDGFNTIYVGLDTDRDGELDDSEVTDTFTVKDGKDGEDGISSDISVTIEEPGDNCEFGGIKITSTTASGTEVNYVCHGGCSCECEETAFTIDFNEHKTQLPAAIHPKNGCEGNIGVFTVKTGSSKKEKTRVYHYNSTYQKVLYMDSWKGGIIGFDFTHYNPKQKGNQKMGNVKAISFDVNVIKGQGAYVSGWDINNKYHHQNLSNASGWKTIQLNWANMKSLYIVNNGGKFKVDNVVLSCEDCEDDMN